MATSQRGRYEPGARSEGDLVVPVAATCAGGHRVSVAPSSIGEPCWACESPLRVPDAIDERIVRHEAARVGGTGVAGVAETTKEEEAA